MGAALLALGLAAAAPAAMAARAPAAATAVPIEPATDATLLAAREALRLRQQPRLDAARDALLAAQHPLAQWADYWALTNRLPSARQSELDAFYGRWPGSYVEDRLRNDWLLELGKRRDWAQIRLEYPRFRMDDDRQVRCYALMAEHRVGREVREAARDAWYAQRDADDGCALLASSLREARLLSDAEVWHKARLATEANRPQALRAALALIGPAAERAATEWLDNPMRYLSRLPRPLPAAQRPQAVLALMRLAAQDPEVAAQQLRQPWGRELGSADVATAWAHVTRHAALKRLPEAAVFGALAWERWDAAAPGRSSMPPWSDEVLAWHVRAALQRPEGDALRWPLVRRAVEAMSEREQRQSAWVFWRARAEAALAPAGREGEAARARAQAALDTLANDLGFYGKLAAETQGRAWALPPAPPPLTAQDHERAAARPGLSRALLLIDLGLRSEGNREWNFSLRGLDERELRAAAARACARSVWDRCINTSERTRQEVDLAQRFPLPLRAQIEQQAQAAGLPASLLFGLIRQESRFLVDARSHVGASGLMQLMPATARWMARQLGVPLPPGAIDDPDLNLQLGAAYLRRVLNDFEGSLPMAAAAYNAGPGRPRRWRDGSTLEPAAWAEGIPFNETRDYVQKVLSNSVIYEALLGDQTSSLLGRLGPPVGPRLTSATAPDRNLP